jgi:two-component system, LuxR family, sensor kinase FixL
MANQDTKPLLESGGKPSSVFRAALTILLFATAICVFQRLTFTLRIPPFQRTPIWTPGGLPFTALLLAPPRRWWIYYVGSCLGAFAAFFSYSEIPVATALVATQVFFLAVALGAWSIRRLGTDPPLGSPTALLVFVVFAIVVVPVIAEGSIGLIRIAFGADDFWPVGLRAVLADALGMLIATPALTLTVVNYRARWRAASGKRLVEIVGLAACLLLVGYYCFQRPAADESLPALLSAPLPLLLWAAMRFGLAGVSWALLGVALQTTWSVLHGRGPFASSAPAENILHLQFFLLTISLPLMVLAAVSQERYQAFSALSRSEQEVRRQYAQLATIYHSAPIGLAFVDTQLRYVSINDYLAEINGRPADAHLGRTVREVLPHLADTIEPLYRRVIETGQPLMDVEIHGMTASRPGIERNWLVSRYPVKNPQGGLLGVITVVQEITERKWAEEVRQELTHASRLALVGALTASIAHEINQPLGAILSNADAAEMLLESTPAPLDEVRQILDDIRKDDLRASEVIRRLRGLLRKREMEMRPLEINQVISEVLWLVRAESRRRGVAVATELAPDLPVVRGDKVHLQQVLLNLFLNGVEAMADVPGQKRLSVRSALNENGYLEIAVSDVGVGIPPDRLSGLFDPFFSTKKEGMGLGLSISRSLVEGHGGRIWAENNPRGGATFRFTLPTEGEQPNRKSRGIVSAPVGTGK